MEESEIPKYLREKSDYYTKMASWLQWVADIVEGDMKK